MSSLEVTFYTRITLLGFPDTIKTLKYLFALLYYLLFIYLLSIYLFIHLSIHSFTHHVYMFLVHIISYKKLKTIQCHGSIRKR